MQLDFFTILLEILVREQLSRRKLSFREVVYMLVPRYYPLGDYYESIYTEGQVVKPYIFVEICI